MQSADDSEMGGTRNEVKRRKVLVILPRGEAYRNFVYSGFLALLSDNLDVSVAAVNPGGMMHTLLRGASSEEFTLEPREARFPVLWMRRILDAAHFHYLDSSAVRERRRRVVLGRQHRIFGGSEIIEIVARRFASPGGLALLSRMERRLSRLVRARGFGDTYGDISRFDLVFNTSHSHSDAALPLVEMARWAGVPTCTFLFSWDNLTTQGRIPDVYDSFLAWNEDIAQDLLRIYPRIRDEQVVVTGTPQFDFHFDRANVWDRERWAAEVGIDPTRPVVLYSTSMPYHTPGEPELVEILADCLTDIGLENRPQLLVRVYAKDLSGRFESLRARRTDIVFSPVYWSADWLTPLPEDTALWTSTLYHVACGVNVASTVSLELCMFDKPVVNVAFNPPSVPKSQLDYAVYYGFDHYAPVVSSGAVCVVGDASAMKEALAKALEQPEENVSERREVLEMMFGDSLDGRSGERLAAVVESLAGG